MPCSQKQWKLNKPELKLANCTEGGAFIEGFDHGKFADYLNQVSVDGQLKQKTVRFIKGCPNFEVEAKNYVTKLRLQLDSADSLAKKIIKLEEPASIDKRLQKSGKNCSKNSENSVAKLNYSSLGCKKKLLKLSAAHKRPQAFPLTPSFLRVLSLQ